MAWFRGLKVIRHIPRSLAFASVLTFFGASGYFACGDDTTSNPGGTTDGSGSDRGTGGDTVTGDRGGPDGVTTDGAGDRGGSDSASAEE
jgi:hypothetical protein